MSTKTDIEDCLGKMGDIVRKESYNGSDGCEYPECSDGADCSVELDLVREDAPPHPYLVCEAHADEL